jgi:hypothetical protein
VSIGKWIRKIENELARKEKALAEAASPLMLREPIDRNAENEADGIHQIREVEEPNCST